METGTVVAVHSGIPVAVAIADGTAVDSAFAVGMGNRAEDVVGSFVVAGFQRAHRSGHRLELLHWTRCERIQCFLD